MDINFNFTENKVKKESGINNSKNNSKNEDERIMKNLFNLLNIHLKDPEKIIKKFDLNEENLKKLKDLSKYFFNFLPMMLKIKI
jgi:hypothetical protein